MPVSQTATAAFQKNYFLTVLCNLTQKLTRIGIENRRTTRNLYGLIFTVFTETSVRPAG